MRTEKRNEYKVCWMVLYIVCMAAVLLHTRCSLPDKSAVSIASIVRDQKALSRPHDVELQGDFLYVPGKSGSLAILDVSEPDRPEQVWSKKLGDDAQTVLCQDDYVFVGARDFYSIDATEPAKATVCKRLHNRPQIDRINGMIAWGKHILYANKSGWIGMIDISRPNDPVLVGALNSQKHGAILSPHDIVAYNNHIVIVDQKDGSPFKVRLYRVTDRETGELLTPEHWKVAGSVRGNDLNGANRVDIYGDYALVGCNKANTLAVVDIRNPEKPVTVSVFPFPGEPCGLNVSGAILFAAGSQTVQILDLTNPVKPDVLVSFENKKAFPSRFEKTAKGARRYTTINGEKRPSTGNAHDLIYRDGYLYVTAQSDHQVVVLNIKDPKIRKLAAQPPVRFSGKCIPVHVENPVTMTKKRRVRPQSILFRKNGTLTKLLYSTDGSDGVSIATGLAETKNGGGLWIDHPANPVLDRIESDWQGRRAFGTSLTYDGENKRWVMATVGDDTSPHTPGKRAAGLWFSDDLIKWTQYEGNPIITVKTDSALQNTDILPGPHDPPVGMYIRDFQKFDGICYALVQWRGDHDGANWSRMTVMQSAGDLTGPWTFRNICLDPADASDWFNTNQNLNWCQPVRVGTRWYAACQNGVAKTDTDNTRIGIVYSDDYFTWHEFDNPVTAKLKRPDRSPVVSSQQFLLPPENGNPWRILLGARGLHGKRYMYLVFPHAMEKYGG
ncbi:MAG: hypothetical protein U5R06_00130 [candidate division KSB1 bacterium]|nr:hypothetical protein [candidate division KSB1 bacterium]